MGVSQRVIKRSFKVLNKDNKPIVLVLINHLDEDDFLPMITHSAFKEHILVILDTESIPSYASFPTAHLEASFKDPAAVIPLIQQYVQKHHNTIAGIVGLDEEYRYAVSKHIADVFSLPFYEQSTIDAITNKYKQAVQLQKYKAPLPKFVLFNRMEDADAIPFPNVLKIVTGIGSKFVYLNKNRAELAAHLEDFKQKSKQPIHDNLILEEYIGGDEYSCDFLVTNTGDVHILRVVKKITSLSTFPFFGGFYLFNPYHQAPAGFNITALETTCKKIAQAFGLNRGVCMMDFRFYKGSLFIIETTIRPGIAQFIDLMIDLYHYTSLDILIRQILHMDTNIQIPQEQGLLFYISTEQSGTIKQFDVSQLQNGSASYKITHIKKYYEPGQRVEHEANKVTKEIMLGHIVIINIPEDHVASTIKAIQHQLVIDIIPG